MYTDGNQLCPQERAEQDAKTVYEQRNKSRPEIFRK